MFKKLIINWIIRYYSQQIFNNAELDNWHKREANDSERVKGYEDLAASRAMVKNLECILIEDTKQMMKKDWHDDTTRLMRVGAFVRVKGILDKLYAIQKNKSQ